MTEKTRYTDEELEEFKALILQKLEKARKEYETLRADVMNANDTSDTSPTFKVLEEGAYTLSKEESSRLAQRQAQFIKHLQAALVRIENKTYGIDRITGKLIPKERLFPTPHYVWKQRLNKNSGQIQSFDAPGMDGSDNNRHRNPCGSDL